MNICWMNMNEAFFKVNKMKVSGFKYFLNNIWKYNDRLCARNQNFKVVLIHLSRIKVGELWSHGAGRDQRKSFYPTVLPLKKTTKYTLEKIVADFCSVHNHKHGTK